MEINLISTTIPLKDSYANMWWPVEDVKVHKNLTNFSGVSVFVDECIPYVNSITSGKKVAWIIEPPVIKPYPYQWMLNPDIRGLFDLILTYDKNLVDLDPTKIKLLPFGACWVSEHNCKVYPKTKRMSIVASNKRYAPGHILRHDLIKLLPPWVDLYGSGYNEFPHTDEGRLSPFKDYMFSIVIENSQMDNYYTDKIIDCFATGTIPLYWGAKNMGDYYDSNGFFSFNTLEECLNLLPKCTVEVYNSMLPNITYNFNKIGDWASPDRNMLNMLSTYL